MDRNVEIRSMNVGEMISVVDGCAKVVVEKKKDGLHIIHYQNDVKYFEEIIPCRTKTIDEMFDEAFVGGSREILTDSDTEEDATDGNYALLA